MAAPHKSIINDLPQLTAQQAATAISPQTNAECEALTERISEIAGLIKARNLASGNVRSDGPPKTFRQ